MSEVASAYVSLLPSARGFGRKLESQVGGEVRSSGKRLGGLLAAGLATAAGGGALAFLTDTIGAASNLEQSMGGVKAVFGEYADEVEADSRRAANALGLSQNAYNELITVSGAMLKNKGLKDFADQSEKLVNLGADLAATFGGSTREAVEALNAAFRGESDPIERYGVSLNESAVQAELAAKGQAKLTGAALEQAKAQARLNILFQQTRDAQGGAAREHDTLASAQQRLAASWENMSAEIGGQFLPVAASAVGFLTDDVLPAVSAAGGVVKDLAVAFGDLPAPVQAAAGALVAFRIAQAAGFTGSAASGARAGLSRISSGLDSVRLRGMLAADTYRTMRSAQLNFVNGAPQFVGATGRISAGLGAIRTAGAGAGGGLRRGLAGLSSFMGGPWGIALAGATAAITVFAQRQADAKERAAQTKARIQELTEAFDQNTGAITANVREIIKKRLEESGAFKQAEKLGLSLKTVTDAALGQADAIAQLRAAHQQTIRPFGEMTDAEFERQRGIDAVFRAVTAQTPEVEKAAAAARRSAEADGKAAGSLDKYGSAATGAKRAVQGLAAAEETRANAAIKRRRDNIALRQTLADAAKEAREGAKSLDTNTEAGRANMSALIDLADQWQQSSGKVRAANGGYRQMRRTFVDLATQMNGGNRAAARALADDILGIPDRKPKVQIQGVPAARGALAGLAAQIRNLPDATIKVTVSGGAAAGAAIAALGSQASAVGAQRAVMAAESTPDTASNDSGPDRVIVVIGAREFEGYMSEVADDRIAANGSLLTQSGRAL